VLASEVALTLILLVGSGLLIRSVVTMARTELGFEPDRLMRARVVLRAANYPDAAAFSAFYRQFVGRLSDALRSPLVFSSWPTFAEFPQQAVEIDGRPGHVLLAGAVNVGASYFRTMGIALRTGRDISTADLDSDASVAVVSESLARRLWSDATPIGRSLRLVEVTAGGARPPGPWRTVVGVAADVRQAYGDQDLADVYTPYWPTGRFGSFFLRTDRPVPSIVPDLRSVASAIDPHAIVDLPHRLADDNREFRGTRVFMTLLAGFAAIAAFIAVLGIHAVTSYAAGQRAREVAIRLALGASRMNVTRLFLRDGGLVLAAGMIVGLVGALAAGRLLERHVYAVRGFDGPIFLLAGSLLATSALAAAWWPARRASRANPVSGLKDS
jgi:hypothetical protein